jgi:hypothetical protein
LWVSCGQAMISANFRAYQNHARDVPIIGFQYLFSASKYGMLCLMACLRYCVELTMRSRKKKTESGSFAG